jgi:toluene monooxygenase electron transfer component
VRIELAAGDRPTEFHGSPGERLLHAGLRAGVDLPYECASGTCGTCKARLVAGEIEDLWCEAPARKHLRGPDEFLLCQCAAKSDCRIEVRASRASVPAFRPDAGEAVVVDSRRLAPGVLAFAVELDRPIDFQAGQFVGLQFSAAPGFRSYSMVNHGRQVKRLEFVVKRKPDGRLTPWLLDHGIVGDRVQWYGPLGRAVFEPGCGQEILCIAGGTGIAGMMSILRCATDAGHFGTHRGRVFFGVRTLRDAFYLAELEALAGASGGALEVTVALSEEGPPAECAAIHPRLAFRRGFVHDVAKAAVGARYEGIAYLAGPPPAVDASLRVLLAARVPARNIRFDKFT